MRWIAALVTASCLLVASGVRPAEARRGSNDARPTLSIDIAHGVAAHVARRSGAMPDLRLGAFVAPERPTLPRPPRVLALASVAAFAPPPAPATIVATARGPPQPSSF